MTHDIEGEVVTRRGSPEAGHILRRLHSAWPEIQQLVRPRYGALLIGLVLVGISRVAGLLLPLSTKVFMDSVIGRRQAQLLIPLILAVLGATCLQGLASFALNQVLSKAALRLIAELRCKVHAHITSLPVTYYDANKTGVLVSRIMHDVEGVRNLVGTGLVELVGSIATAVFVLFALFWINVQLTLLALSVLVGFTLILGRMIGAVRPVFLERSRITAEVTGRLAESLSGVRVVKGYHAEAHEQGVFSAGIERLLGNALSGLYATNTLSLSATVLMGAVSAMVIFISARNILASQMTLGDFAAFSALLAYLTGPVLQIVSVGVQFSESIAGLERTHEVLSQAPEAASPARTVALGMVRGEVTFEDVTFAYEPGNQVLEGLSFRAKPGSVTAFVGPSGSGKSTIISLIAAFHVPQEGTVRVDGVDLSTVRLETYRSQLGVVLQDTFLFDGTIRENVAFSRPPATEKEIITACRIARVDEFAERLPQSYDTVVGERGVKLSGGQRQRISIARAILANPRILILDEATSSLDSESEALIQEGLRYLKSGRTTFVIAHRLSTIRQAEQILVLEQGRIVESGTPAELLAMRGRYFELSANDRTFDSDVFVTAPELPYSDPERGLPKPPANGFAAILPPLRYFKAQEG